MSFLYETTSGKKFQCNLYCVRCEATTLQDKRCGNRTCKYVPYCSRHLKSILGLVIKDSTDTNGGQGLFAARNFKVGEVISVYYGEVLSVDQFVDRYDASAGPYALSSVDGDSVIDAACIRSPASFANDLSTRTKQRPRANAYNSEYVEVDAKEIDKAHGKNIKKGMFLCVVATKNIRASPEHLVEIHTNYGRNYWSTEGGTYESITKPNRVAKGVELSLTKDRVSPPHNVQRKKDRTRHRTRDRSASPKRSKRSKSGTNATKKKKSKTSKKSKKSKKSKTSEKSPPKRIRKSKKSETSQPKRSSSIKSKGKI